MDFEQQCRDKCQFCKDGVRLRYRDDSGEWIHEGAIQIPGTLGRRHSHVLCLANGFRKEWESKNG